MSISLVFSRIFGKDSAFRGSAVEHGLSFLFGWRFARMLFLTHRHVNAATVYLAGQAEPVSLTITFEVIDALTLRPVLSCVRLGDIVPESHNSPAEGWYAFLSHVAQRFCKLNSLQLRGINWADGPRVLLQP